MRKVFIDTNVLVDLLLERDPWADDAAIIFSMADRKEIELLCCSLSFPNKSRDYRCIHEHLPYARPSNRLILCRPLLLLPSVFPSIGVFSSDYRVVTVKRV